MAKFIVIGAVAALLIALMLYVADGDDEIPWDWDEDWED